MVKPINTSLQETFRQRLPGGGTRHRQRVLWGRVDLIAPHAARRTADRRQTCGESAGRCRPGDGGRYWSCATCGSSSPDRILGRLGRCAQDPQGRDRAFALVDRLMEPGFRASGWRASLSATRGGNAGSVARGSPGEPESAGAGGVEMAAGWYRAPGPSAACKSSWNRRRLRDTVRGKGGTGPVCITSTYFEGAGPGGLANAATRGIRASQPAGGGGTGASTAGHRPPVFAGNRQDATTVKEVVADLRERFGLKRIRGGAGDVEREEQVLGKAGCAICLPRRNL